MLPTIEYCVSTSFGVSKEFHGGRGEMLAGTGQGNVMSLNTCRFSSCMIIRDMEIKI